MTPTTIRLDPKVKKEAQKLAETIGFSFSDLISVALKKAIRDGGVDLRLGLSENGYTSEFETSVLKADKEGAAKKFKTVGEMIKAAKK